jgi:GNAT superfamily N-acetyltransferase
MPQGIGLGQMGRQQREPGATVGYDWRQAPRDLARLFGQAGVAGIEGMDTALSGRDPEGRIVGNILPMAMDPESGERSLAAPRIMELWNTVGGIGQAGGITLGAGPILGGKGRIDRVGARAARAYMGDKYAGEVNVAERGPFISSITVEPEFRGQGIGRELYKEAEELAGDVLVPSPLGLTDDAMRMWNKRFENMASFEANELLDKSKEIGRQYGIKDADLDARLDPLRNTEPEWMAEILNEGRKFRAQFPGDGPATLRSNDGSRGVVISPSFEQGGGWRATYFDENGASGHVEYKTRNEALRNFSAGYEKADDEFIDRLIKSGTGLVRPEAPVDPDFRRLYLQGGAT